MADAVHVEGVETDLSGHGEAFSRYGRYGRCVRTRGDAAMRRCGDAARRYSAPWRGGSVSFTA
ncbi:hypothetical protein CWD88_08125 [Burkholderia pseudomallei]|uniref:Uncharacterized protein n=2 Tax=Burkholderia pseudomallei TaxID=28450 RepID=A0AAX0UD79_BURPE|nr:conserved hypothetical protein [Burkholderia pseudomallei 1106a]AUL61282.1 hypothetical protein BHT10_30640 [Burkholderia pseudomallei]PJO66603.1 hypothetical protein CWD88_08125 [Burkholderia pseudomallei]PPF09165.1 hypothetical protein B9D88_000085 [Burkholderia pseudomallei]